MWHIGSRIMNMKTFEFNQYGKDLAKVNAWIEPMRTEIAKMGLPRAIYSTPWTTDWNHKPVPQTEGKAVMPPGLEKNRFPADFWIQPVGGEFVMGVSKYDAGDKNVLFIANHDAYGQQDIKLELGKPSKPHIFNRKTGKYDSLPIAAGTVNIKLEPAGGAIVLFK